MNALPAIAYLRDPYKGNKRSETHDLMKIGQMEVDACLQIDIILGIDIFFGIQGNLFVSYTGNHRGKGAALYNDAAQQGGRGLRQHGAQALEVLTIEAKLGSAFFHVLDFCLNLYLGPEITRIQGLAYGGLHLLHQVDGLIEQHEQVALGKIDTPHQPAERHAARPGESYAVKVGQDAR